MWQLPYHFLEDVRGRSADRGVNIQQLRRLGEARACFSILRGRKEAWQGRAGHRCCPLPLFPLLLVRQEQLNCLRKLTPRVQIWVQISPSLSELQMEVWDFLHHCKTLYKPFLGYKAALQGMVLPRGLPGGRSGRRGIGTTSSSGRKGWLSSTSLPVHVSYLILAHQSVLLWSRADRGGDAALRATTHGGSAPLQETPACRGGTPAPRGWYHQVLQMLPDGVKDGFSLWLGRLTAQWSVEDEEEAARERRRREREKQLRSQAEEGLNGTSSCSESAGPAQENQ